MNEPEKKPEEEKKEAAVEVKNKKAENVFFNPDNSKKNVGIWKRYKHLPEIIQIEKELAEYCYQT